MGDRWAAAESKAYDVLFFLMVLSVLLAGLVACGGCVWVMAVATLWLTGGL